MSSSINNGSQVLTFDYRQEGTSESFNKLLYTLVPQGIIEGGELSVNSGLVVSIAPFVCYYKDTNNEVGVRLETNEDATITVSQAKPYIVGDFTWINTEDNFMEFKAVESPSDTDIVFGRAIFSSVSNISGFDTTYKTWSKDYYETKDGEPSFKVTVHPTQQLKLNVGKGKAIINGKEVVFNSTQTTSDIQTNVTYSRIVLLCITDEGSLKFEYGNDSSTPSIPNVPYNCLAIAKITFTQANPTSLLGCVEYIYNNHNQTPYINKAISDCLDSAKSYTDTAISEVNTNKQDKITNTIQTSQPTDSNYVGGFTNSSTSTNPTSHNSWTFTNVWNWVKTHLGVRSGTTDSAIGNDTKPIYCNNSGKLIASTSTVGGTSKPMYLNNGTMTAVNDNNANVNLGSENSANIYSANPSFGVSGTLPVSHGGLGTNTLTQGAVLIGNGTNAVTTKSIDTVPTENSSNLITSGGVYNHLSKFKLKYFNVNKDAYNLEGYTLYRINGYNSTYASLRFITNTLTTSTLECSDFPDQIFGDIFLTIFCMSANSQTLNVNFYDKDMGNRCYIRNIITNQLYVNTSFTLSLSYTECAILIGFSK